MRSSAAAGTASAAWTSSGAPTRTGRSPANPWRAPRMAVTRRAWPLSFPRDTQPVLPVPSRSTAALTHSTSTAPTRITAPFPKPGRLYPGCRPAQRPDARNLPVVSAAQRHSELRPGNQPERGLGPSAQPGLPLLHIRPFRTAAAQYRHRSARRREFGTPSGRRMGIP